MINIDGKIEDAAHVVSAGGCKKHWKPAIESRAILEKYGIDVNNRYNGFFLFVAVLSRQDMEVRKQAFSNKKY